MHPSFTTLSIATLAALGAALPTTLEERQGGSYVAVGIKYSGPGCNPAANPIPDPIFGFGNVCQPLDRFGDGAPIASYSTFRANAGCSVTIYTGANCTGTAFSAPVGGCVTGSSPFVSTFVTCT